MLPSSIQTAVVDILEPLALTVYVIVSPSSSLNLRLDDGIVLFLPLMFFLFFFSFFSNLFIWFLFECENTHHQSARGDMLTGILYTYPSRWIKTFCVHTKKREKQKQKKGANPTVRSDGRWRSMIWSIHLFVHDCNVSDRPAIGEQTDVRWSKRTAQLRPSKESGITTTTKNNKRVKEKIFDCLWGMMAPRVKAFIRTPCVMLSDGSLAPLLLSYPKTPP